MKDNASLHLKVQELCDCYATSDHLKEMSEVETDADAHSAALRWISLAALHAVNANARKITMKRNSDDTVTVSANYRESELPSPGAVVGREIVSAMKQITHMQGDKLKMPLALGIRDSSLDLNVEIHSEANSDEVSLHFV